MDPRLEAGSVLAGRYRLERLLGEGGMGVVWAARHELTRKRVALKLVKRADAKAQRTRLIREARAACAVRHPHVREVYDLLETDDGMPLMVMEYLAGESLSDKLRREGELALPEAAAIVLPVVSAVGTAHALGIIHRDLKPENIFLEEGPPRTVKVLDFGIAKLTSPEETAGAPPDFTASGALLGTPYYMSPEQVFGDKDLDLRSDIWALGLVLYRCLSGTLPTRAESVGQVFKNIVARPIRPLEQVASDLPSDITAMVGRMLSRARKDRPGDLREVAEVLARHTDVRVPAFDAPSSNRAPSVGRQAGVPADATAIAPPTSEADPTSTVPGSGTTAPPAAVRTPGVSLRTSDGRVSRAAAAALSLSILAAGGAWFAREGQRASLPATALAASSEPSLPPTPSPGEKTLPPGAIAASSEPSLPPTRGAPRPREPLPPAGIPPVGPAEEPAPSETTGVVTKSMEAESVPTPATAPAPARRSAVDPPARRWAAPAKAPDPGKTPRPDGIF